MRATVFILTVMVVCASAGGQAENARLATWQQTMRELGTLLAGDDSAAVVSAVEGASLRQFSSTAKAKVVDLFDACSGSLLLGARGYAGSPQRAATDMGTDFAASDLPETIKQRFIPPDAAAAREADKIAAQWIGDALAADEKSWVGLIVLWRGHQGLPSLTDAYSRNVVFVLVAGGFTEEGTPRLRQIVFGNPLDAAN